MGDVTRRRAPLQPHNALVASAQVIKPLNQTQVQYDSWQDEAWDFYDSGGEFYSGITWLSNALSRVRLLAAKLMPGGDEPEAVNEGPVAELVEQLAGGIGGQAMMMGKFGIHLGVPGVGWLVGEDVADGVRRWEVKSADEIRVSNRNGGKSFEIQVEESAWRPLSQDSLVVRIWNPHPRYSWRPTSAALPAIPIMRELDMESRAIMSMMVSRLALNGLLIFPQEATFPIKPQYAQEVDPFIAELIDTVTTAIQNPGSAASAVPVPLKMPAALIEKVRYLQIFQTEDIQGRLNARDKTVERLARTLHIPTEALLGVGQVNHWTAWQIDETGIKLYISPIAEVLCDGLTRGYLEPMMAAAGEPMIDADGSRYVIWYDTSNLTVRPDLSAAADAAFDRGTISMTAYRREKGFDEADAPTRTELTEIINLQALKQPALAAIAYEELTGTPVPAPAPLETGGPDSGEGEPPSPTPGAGAGPPQRQTQEPTAGLSTRPLIDVEALAASIRK